MRTVLDWNGDEVSLAESKGGVLAFVDPFAGLLLGGTKEDHPTEIERKLFKSRHQNAYQDEDLDAVVKKLGFYCDLQSVNSEDAIIWSVFGPLIYAPASVRAEFCARLFHLIEAQLKPPQSAKISLWHHVLHPDTSGPGGPEFDFLIETPKVVIVGEAKWDSSVDTHQGKNKDKDQIMLRKEYLEKHGRRIYPTVTTFVVLGVHLNEAVVQTEEYRVDDFEILLRNVPWENLCSITPHPAEEELPMYFQWKKGNSSRNRKKILRNPSAIFRGAPSSSCL